MMMTMAGNVGDAVEREGYLLWSQHRFSEEATEPNKVGIAMVRYLALTDCVAQRHTSTSYHGSQTRVSRDTSGEAVLISSRWPCTDVAGSPLLGVEDSCFDV